MPEGSTVEDSKIKILFTCVGRRVSLVREFKRAAEEINKKVEVIGVENNPLSPALYVCDKTFGVETIEHPDYIGQLIKIVKEKGTDLIIPTIDHDLKLLSKNKSEFEKVGCKMLLSSLEIVEICQDKRMTEEFLKSNNFGCPELFKAEEIKTDTSKLPVFLKPWDGSASKGNAKAETLKELEFYSNKIRNCIFQEFIDGTEYTCDVYVDFDMQVRCVVPRKRIEVRAGEVSKAQINKITEIMEQTEKLVERLKAGPGVITIQLFYTGEKEIKFIEINPRFGGGVPLSVKAGADFPKWILKELSGEKPDINFDGFEDGMIMLRYDDEIWLNSKSERIL